uniref:K Homology domain-containing protein n=1 Tax=Panagrolaimus superbus TaxID=310955 RepID=A0A914Y588_9BILA
MTVEELLIPNDVVGLVIGRRGKYINALRQQHNCSIEIKQVSQTTHLCTVQGDPLNTRWVCQKILGIIKQHHFVPGIINRRLEHSFNTLILTPPPLQSNDITLPFQNMILNDVNGCNPSSSNVNPKSEALLLLSQFKCVICYEKFRITDGCITCTKNLEDPLLINNSFHSMCIDCICRYAHSAIMDIPVAYGGLGLKCVLPECRNVFLLCKLL